MRTSLLAPLSFTLALALNLSAQDTNNAGLKEPKQRGSYAIGVNFGSRLAKDGVEIDAEALHAGITDALASKAKMSTKEMHDALQEFQQQYQAGLAARGEKSKKEGVDYMAANKKKEGVKSLPVTKDGKVVELQYKVLKEGDGPSPKSTDEVTVHYKGTLINGTEFDSSYSRNEPATFALDHVIKGWTEALQHMKTGAKWELYIPAELAYDQNPPPGSGIPANAMLIFQVELLKVKPSEANPAAALPTTLPTLKGSTK